MSAAVAVVGVGAQADVGHHHQVVAEALLERRHRLRHHRVVGEGGAAVGRLVARARARRTAAPTGCRARGRRSTVARSRSTDWCSIPGMAAICSADAGAGDDEVGLDEHAGVEAGLGHQVAQGGGRAQTAGTDDQLTHKLLREGLKVGSLRWPGRRCRGRPRRRRVVGPRAQWGQGSGGPPIRCQVERGGAGRGQDHRVEACAGSGGQLAGRGRAHAGRPRPGARGGPRLARASGSSRPAVATARRGPPAPRARGTSRGARRGRRRCRCPTRRTSRPAAAAARAVACPTAAAGRASRWPAPRRRACPAKGCGARGEARASHAVAVQPGSARRSSRSAQPAGRRRSPGAAPGKGKMETSACRTSSCSSAQSSAVAGHEHGSGPSGQLRPPVAADRAQGLEADPGGGRRRPRPRPRPGPPRPG